MFSPTIILLALPKTVNKKDDKKRFLQNGYNDDDF